MLIFSIRFKHLRERYVHIAECAPQHPTVHHAQSAMLVPYYYCSTSRIYSIYLVYIYIYIYIYYTHTAVANFEKLPVMRYNTIYIYDIVSLLAGKMPE